MTALRETVEAACAAGVEILTLFAFSTDNWKRPEPEIQALMGVLQTFAERERSDLVREGVEVRVFGELDRLDESSLAAVRSIVDATRGGNRLLLNLLISYGGREEIARAARKLAIRVRDGLLDPERIDAEAVGLALYTGNLPDPDLLIRTSGEFRISNFMLWQLAYAELHITSVCWPDFTRSDFFDAILDYQRRERRFGRIAAGSGETGRCH